MRKLGIYVQVPFCQTKCTYCNFHTGVVASSRFAPYVEAVCREIREHRDLLRAAGVGEDLAEKAHSQEWRGPQSRLGTGFIWGGGPGPAFSFPFSKTFKWSRGKVSGGVVGRTLVAQPAM